MSTDVVVGENVIPSITDPRGQHWRQPNPENFAIDNEVAMMSQDDFNKLREYSTTTPSGVYPGKCWRSLMNGVWLLRWYAADDGDPRGLLTPCRKIIIVE